MKRKEKSDVRKVAQYDPNTGKLLAVYPSIKEAAESIYHANPAHICACCKGRLKTAYGFAWRYHKGDNCGKGFTQSDA